MSTLIFHHFRFGLDDGDPELQLAPLLRAGWERAGEPRAGIDLSGRRVAVYRLRLFPARHPAAAAMAAHTPTAAVA